MNIKELKKQIENLDDDQLVKLDMSIRENNPCAKNYQKRYHVEFDFIGSKIDELKFILCFIVQRGRFRAVKSKTKTKQPQSQYP